MTTAFPPDHVLQRVDPSKAWRTDGLCVRLSTTVSTVLDLRVGTTAAVGEGVIDFDRGDDRLFCFDLI